MRLTESRLRRIIRDVIIESYDEFNDMTPFSLPPSQTGTYEDREKVYKWLKGPFGQTWWKSASMGKSNRGCEIKITSQDIARNPKFRNKKCMVSGKDLKPGKYVVIQSQGYKTDGFAEWAQCRKFADDHSGLV